MELEEIIKRLESLGHIYKAIDEYPIEFCIEKVTKHILNATNQLEVPEELNHIAIDMVCGEFLKLAYSLGTLPTQEIESTVKAITEGDTTVTFVEGEGAEKRFYSALDYLIKGHEDDFIKFRCLTW